jgi:nicotinate phosphoribosyltransferase
VQAAVDVIRELGLTEGLGIRLDSGDLARLSRQARAILDDAGFPQVRILASGGLDEHALEQLVSAGAPIDAFGVGTRVGVSADSPYLDSAYKLVEVGGRPVLKLSPEKVTAPGRKQVFRRPGMADEVVGLREEPTPEGSRPLLEPFMKGGRRTAKAFDLGEARRRFQQDLAELPEPARRLRSPSPPVARPSELLQALSERVAAEVRRRGL